MLYDDQVVIKSYVDLIRPHSNLSYMNQIDRDLMADGVLKYISEILMEEELEDHTFIPQDSALRAAEKSFSDILAEKFPASSSKAPPYQSQENQVCSRCNIHDYSSTKVVSSTSIPDTNDGGLHYARAPASLQFHSPPSYGQADSCVAFCGSLSRMGRTKTWESHRRGNEMVLDFANKRVTPVVLDTVEKWDQSAHEKLREMVLDFANKRVTPVVLDTVEKWDHSAHEKLREMKNHLIGQSSEYNGSTNCRKSLVKTRELVDMNTLLVHCAEAVAANDHRSATELLTNIRQHSTPFGNGSQRLAHCFANAIEARLFGTGSEVYAALASNKVTPPDMLKACRLFMSASPFLNMSNFFESQTILELAADAERLHIVHFGILYGFSWQTLIQHLSTRPGGPPVLRITGIVFPQPGYGSAATHEEVEHYLSSYCEKFNVRFEYDTISQNLDSIQLKDLKIERDEVTVVSCLYRFRYLLDETVAINSQRDAALNLIKRINPSVFILGISNGAFSSPFFISRFREALFYYSSLFDMLEANAARDDSARVVFEQEIFGKEILNVVACEGSERMERPEKYKQWQVRNARAGLRQLPLKQEMMKKVKEHVKSCYHKDFLVDQDGQWMLQGWKGRILLAISCWKSA